MNNSIYFFLFDSIINAYLIKHCGRNASNSESIGLVVSSHCEYFGSIAFPAIVDLGLRISKLGKSSVTYEVGVFERGDENPKAVGGYTHVFVERKTRRPVAEGMPEDVRKGLNQILNYGKAKL